MNILTDEEISLMAHNIDDADWNDINYRDCWHNGFKAAAREVEAAVLSKLAEQAGEPVGYLHVGGLFGNELEDWEFEAEQRVCDQINEESYGKELSLDLYTEAQLIAAQQRTAEACAKLCAKRSDTLREPACLGDATAIRNSEWREYQ